MPPLLHVYHRVQFHMYQAPFSAWWRRAKTDLIPVPHSYYGQHELLLSLIHPDPGSLLFPIAGVHISKVTEGPTLRVYSNAAHDADSQHPQLSLAIIPLSLSGSQTPTHLSAAPSRKHFLPLCVKKGYSVGAHS